MKTIDSGNSAFDTANGPVRETLTRTHKYIVIESSTGREAQRGFSSRAEADEAARRMSGSRDHTYVSRELPAALTK